MSKDYKTGLIVGLAAAVVALVWLATRPSLSPQSRMLRSAQANATQDDSRAGERPTNERSGTQEEPAAEIPAPSAAQPPTPTDTDVLARLLPETKRAPAGEPAPDPTAPADLTVYEKEEKIQTTRFHIVRKDETLSAISQQHYGSPNQWRKIAEANKDTITDANKISPGTKIIIPD